MEPNVPAENATQDTTSSTVTETSGASTLLAEVAANIKSADIKGRLIAMLTEEEVVLRANLLKTAFEKLNLQRKALTKIKPDVITYNANGEESSASFSKAKIDELKKAKDEMGKLEKALEQALSGDYTKLKEIVK